MITTITLFVNSATFVLLTIWVCQRQAILKEAGWLLEKHRLEPDLESIPAHKRKNDELNPTTPWITGLGIFALSIIYMAWGIFAVPPLSISFRSSLIGAGSVMMIANDSDSALHDVTVHASNLRLNQRMDHVVADTLEPRHSVTVGWMETGWSFEPGEHYKVGTKENVGSVSGTVPE